MSKFWNQLVKHEVWGSEPGKKGLIAKLRHRWVNFQPRLDHLGRPEEMVTSLYCNDKHIFCGQGSGLVRVYTVTSGEYVRDLVPREAPRNTPESSSESECDSGSESEFHEDRISYTLVTGGKGVVAAVTWRAYVTVWGTGDNMDWVASYQYRCDWCCEIPCECGVKAVIYDIKVTPHGKIVLVATKGIPRTPGRSSGWEPSLTSVLIMKKSEDGWTVDDPEKLNRWMGHLFKLGCHGDYFVLDDWDCALRDWRSPRNPLEHELFFGSADINTEELDSGDELPWFQGLKFGEITGRGVYGLILEPPFLILSYKKNASHSRLMVYQMDTFEVLKAFEYSRGDCVDLNSNEYVVVQLNKCWRNEVYKRKEVYNCVFIYDKKMLLDTKKIAEDVNIQRIEINRESITMSINRTNLVFAQRFDYLLQRNQEHDSYLCVLNFWVGGREELDIREGRKKLVFKKEGDVFKNGQKDGDDNNLDTQKKGVSSEKRLGGSINGTDDGKGEAAGSSEEEIEGPAVKKMKQQALVEGDNKDTQVITLQENLKDPSLQVRSTFPFAC